MAATLISLLGWGVLGEYSSICDEPPARMFFLSGQISFGKIVRWVNLRCRIDSASPCYSNHH